MKASDPPMAFGTVIGTMRPLKHGRSLIPILVEAAAGWTGFIHSEGLRWG